MCKYLLILQYEYVQPQTYSADKNTDRTTTTIPHPLTTIPHTTSNDVTNVSTNGYNYHHTNNLLGWQKHWKDNNFNSSVNYYVTHNVGWRLPRILRRILPRLWLPPHQQHILLTKTLKNNDNSISYIDYYAIRTTSDDITKVFTKVMITTTLTTYSVDQKTEKTTTTLSHPLLLCHAQLKMTSRRFLSRLWLPPHQQHTLLTKTLKKQQQLYLMHWLLCRAQHRMTSRSLLPRLWLPPHQQHSLMTKTLKRQPL